MTETIYESVVCPSCGCLCDDIDVVIEDNKVKSIRNVCEWGINKFLFTKKFTQDVRRARIDTPMIREGNLVETDYETAISTAVHLLEESKKPLIYGLTNSGYEAQKSALQIARRLRGWFEPRGAGFLSPYYSAMRESHFYLAPLDEVKNNADCVIYWGCNPIHSTPRHLARYSVFPKGRCKERGSQDRLVFTVDVVENEMSRACRKFLQVEPGTDYLVMEAMTRLLRRETVDDYTGDILSIQDMVKKMARVSYGAIFFGLGLSSKGNAQRNIGALMRLTRELNNKNQWVTIPLYDDFNTSGAIQLLLREFSRPTPMDFSQDHEMAPEKPTLLEDIHEVDTALVIGEDPFWSLSAQKSEHLKEIPMVLIDPFWTRTTNKCSVVFPTAVNGVEAEGIAYRMDGLPLKLNKVIECDHPSDEAILKDIYERLS